jgi:hypothetical protein
MIGSMRASIFSSASTCAGPTSLRAPGNLATSSSASFWMAIASPVGSCRDPAVGVRRAPQRIGQRLDPGERSFDHGASGSGAMLHRAGIIGPQRSSH